MDFSICIVSHECRDKLRRCLESIRAHRPTVAHEVIVVDNGSTDGTPEMLRQQFFWVRAIANPDNRGFSAACNQAVGVATGRVVMMLNPDTVIPHGALDALCTFVRERSWIGAVGPRLVDAGGKPEMSCREFPTLMNALWYLTGLARRFSASKVFGHLDMTWWDHSQPRGVDWLSAAALVFTRSAWDKAGPLDERFFVQGAELDWQKRLARQGLERWYLPTAQITHDPDHPAHSAGSSDIVATHQAVTRYFHKHHGFLSALLLRLFSMLTMLPKAIAYGLLGVFPSWRDRAWRRARLHWQLSCTALRTCR